MKKISSLHRIKIFRPMAVCLLVCLFLIDSHSLSAQMTATLSGSSPLCQGSVENLAAQVFNFGSGTLTFQFKKNGVNITGSQSHPVTNVCILPYSTVSNGDVFTCVVSSTTNGTATSNSYTVTVTTPQNFTISISPNNITFCQGATVNFTSTASTAVSTYQWNMNGSTVPGSDGKYIQYDGELGDTVEIGELDSHDDSQLYEQYQRLL